MRGGAADFRSTREGGDGTRTRTRRNEVDGDESAFCVCARFMDHPPAVLLCEMGFEFRLQQAQVCLQ
jgi:hypothetical protein